MPLRPCEAITTKSALCFLAAAMMASDTMSDRLTTPLARAKRSTTLVPNSPIECQLGQSGASWGGCLVGPHALRLALFCLDGGRPHWQCFGWCTHHGLFCIGQRGEFGLCTLAVAQTQNLGRWYVGHSPSGHGFGRHIGLGLVARLSTQSSALVYGLRLGC